ncbi:MAG TPA: TldD/PmbA family protein [Candidatus Brocadiia bacterium]|nr:TldD/PmbA family protein [Candidatus Brocadiia bacterium]
MAENIAEQILEEALKQCGKADVLMEDIESLRVVFEHNNLKSIETKQMTGIGLRVIKDGRIGFAAATDLRKPGRLVEMALEAARFGQTAAFDFPSPPQIGTPVKVFDKRAAEFQLQTAIERGRECVETALAADEHYDCSVEISKSLERWRIINSAGLDYSEEATGFDADVSVLLVLPEGGLLWIGEGRDGHALCDDIPAFAREALRKHKLGEKNATVTTGTYPVLFLPKAVDVVLEAIEVGCNGKFIQKGVSPLGDKLGERIADAGLTIWDDPTMDYAPGCGTLDSEGLACDRKPLVERGVVRNFIFDLQTAGLMGVRPTGNAGRSFADMPAPHYNSLVVEPGRRTTAEIIAGMRRGIVVDQVLGAGQSNVLSGEFSVNIDLGFLVEDGRVVGRVKDCMVAGNTFSVLNSLVETGSDREWHGAMLTPALLFDGLQVAARSDEE